MKQYHICCATDANYIGPCMVMLLSLCKTNAHIEWVVHICTWNLSESSKEKLTNSLSNYNISIHFYEIDMSKLTGVKIRKQNPLPPVAYYRIFLANILPDNIDRILYLDCDLLIMRHLDAIFDIDISEYALAAVEATHKLSDEHRCQLNFLPDTPYFNSGVMLINLKYWRENEVCNPLLTFSQMERRVFFHDQDALNYVFKNCWKRLPLQYNRLFPSRYPHSMFHSKKEMKEFDNPAVIHFWWYIKPWYNIKWLSPKYNQYKRLYYSYLKELPDDIPQPVSNLKWSACLKLYIHLVHGSIMRLLFISK